MPPNSGTQGHGGSRSGNEVDIIEMRDAIANTMVVAKPPLPPGAEPLAVNAVVCLAGCDQAPGSIVYSDRPQPTLASLGAPSLAPLPAAPTPGGPVATSTITCLAGCYEPVAKVTVASLRNAQPAPAPQRIARAKPAIAVDAPVTLVAPNETTPSPTAAAEPQRVKLRSGFAASSRKAVAKRVAASARPSKAAAKPGAVRAPEYGKVVVVPKAMQTPAPTSPAPEPTAVAPPSTPPAEPQAPVSTYAPQRKPEKKKTERTAQKQATVSNDWFNRINQERKAKEAASKSAD